MAVNQQATPELTRVVDYIVAYLAAGGMTHIFGVDGANIEDLFDAAYFRDDITAVLAKHEFSAAAMADGYSRSGARLGVVMATSGGGLVEFGGRPRRIIREPDPCSCPCGPGADGSRR